jgi:hypothetical protein
MAAPILDRRDLEFMLYEVFDVESMNSRERYADHNRETINAAMDTAQAKAYAEGAYALCLLGAMAEKDIDLVLANSVKYLDLFGNVVIAWIWLQQGMARSAGPGSGTASERPGFLPGKAAGHALFLSL